MKILRPWSNGGTEPSKGFHAGSIPAGRTKRLTGIRPWGSILSS
jgi:hypothetical protein